MIDTHWQHVLSSTIQKLEQAHIDYTLINTTAISLQGVRSNVDPTIYVEIQWDRFQDAYTLFQAITPIQKTSGSAHFSVQSDSITISVSCHYNSVVVTDPDRLQLSYADHTLWVKALDYFVRTLSATHPDVIAITNYWQTLQQQNSQYNEAAWNQETYDAWIHRLGTPQEHAQHLQKEPRTRLSSLAKYLPDLTGKQVINLMGSHGSKALAMALLGATVTVVDISQENARYAREVARELSIPLHYVVADVLNLPAEMKQEAYDLVVMELGILHYFINLAPLADVVMTLLRPGGILVLQDFHPISTKLITSKGKKHKVSGNYFDKALTTTQVAFTKHLPTEQQKHTKQVYLRKWTLGEVVTAFASSGLHIRQLIEEPNSKIDDIGLPKLFTLIAEKHQR